MLIIENAAKIPSMMPASMLVCLRTKVVAYIVSLAFARRPAGLFVAVDELGARREIERVWSIRSYGPPLSCIDAASVPAVPLECLLRAISSPLWFFYFSPYHHIHLAICCLPCVVRPTPFDPQCSLAFLFADDTTITSPKLDQQ